MLVGFFQGIVHDRKLMREAQVNFAIRWFAGWPPSSGWKITGSILTLQSATALTSTSHSKTSGSIQYILFMAGL